MKEIWKVVQKLSREQMSVVGGAGGSGAYELVQKHEVTAGIPSDLIIQLWVSIIQLWTSKIQVKWKFPHRKHGSKFLSIAHDKNFFVGVPMKIGATNTLEAPAC